MNFKKLSNFELHKQTKAAALAEKNATLALLEYLEEVERRMLYAELGFSSLWVYVHKELGYSEAQTSERVGAMRLIKKIPEARSSIESNKLTLTTAAKLASHARKEKLSLEETIALLPAIESKSSREVERTLTASTGAPPTSKITIDADDELVEMLERVKALHSDPTASTGTLLKKVLKEYLEKRAPKPAQKVPKKQIVDFRTASRAPEVQSTGERSSRYIPVAVKNLVRLRSRDQCEHVSRVTGRRCESRAQLEFDHIHPFAFGGSNDASNIRHLCRGHNRFEALLVFGDEKMDQWLKRH